MKRIGVLTFLVFACLTVVSAISTAVAAQTGETLFAFFGKVRIPGGWESEVAYGELWLIQSPDNECKIVAQLQRYEAVDAHLLVREKAGTSYTKTRNGFGYIAEQYGERVWFAAEGEMVLAITTSGPCNALGPALASIQAVKDRSELEALRNVAKDPEQLSLYWSAEELPDMAFAARGLADREVLDWLTYASPSKAENEEEQAIEDDIAENEYQGTAWTASYPETWNVQETDEGITFISADKKQSVTAISKSLGQNDNAAARAFARELLQQHGGKNLFQMRSDRAELENRFRFTIPESGAVVVLDARRIPARMVTYSEACLAFRWENEMDGTFYVQLKEKE